MKTLRHPLQFTIYPAEPVGRTEMVGVRFRWGVYGVWTDLPTIPRALVREHAALLTVLGGQLAQQPLTIPPAVRRRLARR